MLSSLIFGKVIENFVENKENALVREKKTIICDIECFESHRFALFEPRWNPNGGAGCAPLPAPLL